LRKGNVPYSAVLREAHVKVEGWSLLLKKRKGLKVSSRKLQRTFKKGDIPNNARHQTLLEIQDELKAATVNYYKIKESAKN
jgi:hypothetical protein